MEYAVWGTGERYLLAFSGFGRAVKDYEIFVPYLGEKYRIIGINHFHHGNSHYPGSRIEKNPIEKEELKELLAVFLKEQNIDRFSVMAYSFGGKIALTLAELMPEKIEKLFLFAPDGIKNNAWYKIATHSNIIKTIWRYIIVNPGIFFKTIDFLKKMRLIHSKTYQFLLLQTDSEEKRKLVYDVWLSYKKIIPDLQKVINNINQYGIELKLFYGKYDTIIPFSTGKSFAGKIEQPNVLVELESGHNLLTEKNANAVQKLI